MGIVTMGIPQEPILQLANRNNTSTFIETGTFQGGTTRWAAKHFDRVHTIERAQGLFDTHSGKLSKIDGVTPHLGDSREILPSIIEDLGTDSAVFWLDGHWSGGETAGEGDECPLMDELKCLAGRGQDIVLIDDARLFMCAPPRPHDPNQWPTIADIVHALSDTETPPLIQVVDDVIFIVPDRPDLRDYLIGYSQTRSADFWNQFAAMQG